LLALRTSAEIDAEPMGDGWWEHMGLVPCGELTVQREDAADYGTGARAEMSVQLTPLTSAKVRSAAPLSR
jgi:hypothetical protein